MSPDAGTPAASPDAESPAASPDAESPAASPDAASPDAESPAASPDAESPAAGAFDTCEPASSDVPVEAAGLEPPATAVTLDFWNPFTGPDGAYMAALVDRFNAEAENVQVTNTTQTEYYTQINNAAQGGGLPDIAIMHLDQVAINAANGIITPVDDLSSQLELSADDFTEAVWTGTFYQDVQYSIPLDIHPAVLYFNRQYVQEPPTDQASFEAALQSLQDQGVTGPVWSNHFFSAGLLWASLFYQGGGEWTNADFTEATYNSAAGVEAAQYLRGLVEGGLHPQDAEPDAEVSGFEGGTSGMAVTGIWQTCRFANALGDDFGVAPIPSIFGDGAWAGSHTLAVPRDVEGDERQGAYYFIDWITRNASVWAAGGQIPARSSVRESANFTGLQFVSDLAPGAEAAQFPPPIPGSADLMGGPGGANEKVIEVITGGGDAQAALDQSAAQYTQILEQTKQQYGY
jgi:multiple sugar transport system substrate-binding protein